MALRLQVDPVQSRPHSLPPQTICATLCRRAELTLVSPAPSSSYLSWNLQPEQCKTGSMLGAQVCRPMSLLIVTLPSSLFPRQVEFSKTYDPQQCASKQTPFLLHSSHQGPPCQHDSDIVAKMVGLVPALTVTTIVLVTVGPESRLLL